MASTAAGDVTELPVAVRRDGGVLADRLRMLHISKLWLVSMSLNAVVELGVHRILAAAGRGHFLTPEAIAAHIPNSTPFTAGAVGRFLRLLTAFGAFDESVETTTTAAGEHTTPAPPSEEEEMVVRKYALNSASWMLVADEAGTSMEPMVRFDCDPTAVACGHRLAQAGLDGEPAFVKAHGVDAWTLCARDPRLDALFNRYMASASKLEVADFLAGYGGFRDYAGTVVDVAGGYGQTVGMIVQAHPHLKGVNFDQPHVIANAPPFPGVEHVAGDMFESVPSGDAIFMKWILHDWSDKDCARILKNVRRALPPHGKLMIVEAVLPTHTAPDLELQAQLQVDLFMMTVNVNGRERSEAEFRKLVLDAGFSSIRIAYPGGGCFFVLEALV